MSLCNYNDRVNVLDTFLFSSSIEKLFIFYYIGLHLNRLLRKSEVINNQVLLYRPHHFGMSWNLSKYLLLEKLNERDIQRWCCLKMLPAAWLLITGINEFFQLTYNLQKKVKCLQPMATFYSFPITIFFIKLTISPLCRLHGEKKILFPYFVLLHFLNQCCI